MRTEDEPGLAGITVNVGDADIQIRATTANDGSYRFADLRAGDYFVQIATEILNESFAPTFDPNGEIDAAAPATIFGGEVTGMNFGLQPTRLGSISGLIWLDTADFGVGNAGETGMDGVVIQLLDSAGNVAQTYVAQADGVYRFADLLPSDYTVRIDGTTLPDPIFVTHNLDGSSSFDARVTLPPGADVQGVEFGLVGTF